MSSLDDLMYSVINKERAHGLDLRNRDFSGRDLSGLRADNLNMAMVNLQKAKLHKTYLGNCCLGDGRLQGSDWSFATIRKCVLDEADCIGAHFDNARIEDSSAKGANLTRASLRSTKLTETSFERSILREAVLDNAEGDGVEFRGADLVSATLIAARLDEADFRGADLRGADLSRGRFHSADFRGAILGGACFDSSDCQGARFDEGEDPLIHRRSKAGTDEVLTFDKIAAHSLRESLASLPTIFATREGVARELPDHLQQVIDTLGSTCYPFPEEWMPWLESLLQKIQDGRLADMKELLVALEEVPPSLQDVTSGTQASELLDHIQQLANAIDSNVGQLPEEWKPLLESLMKITQNGPSFDPKALLDVLSSLVQYQSQKEKTSDQTSNPP